MAIFFTSDLHFNHNNILKYEPESRPFATVQKMNEKIIENINDAVAKEDTLWILGDIFMGRKEDAEGLLEQINCEHVHVVLGNHDKNSWKKDYFSALGWEVLDRGVVNYCNGFQFICRHESIEETGEELYTNKSIYLYGHLHGKAPKGLQDDNTYHIGLDTNDLRPVNADQILLEYYGR